MVCVPSQFERREERSVETRDTWVYVWVAILGIGIGVFILIDSTVGMALAVTGGVGFSFLAFKRGVGDVPDGGGSLP